jgi:hypothetical protein
MRLIALCIFMISIDLHISFCQASNRFPFHGGSGTGFIDGTGKRVVPSRYMQVREFHEGVAAVLRDEKWGYVDSNGLEVVPPTYRDAGDFSEGVGLILDVTGQVSYIDHDWHKHPLNCVTVEDDSFAGAPPPFSEGLTESRLGQKTEYIDRSCNIMFVVDGAGEPFAEGLAVVCSGQRCGYYDHSGNPTIPMKFTFGCRFEDGLACVDLAGGRGYIDRNGKIVIQPQFKNGDSFSEGLAPVEIEGKWGYIDKAGKIVIQPKYDEAFQFSEGVAAVAIRSPSSHTGDALTGKKDVILIDHHGQPALPIHFEDVTRPGFKGGLVEAVLQGHDGYFDRQGKPVLPH